MPIGYCSLLTVALHLRADGSIELCEFDGTAHLKFGCRSMNAEVFMNGHARSNSGSQSLNIARSNFGTIPIAIATLSLSFSLSSPLIIV